MNAVRLNYAWLLGSQRQPDALLDMAQELTKRGMYVMPSDHTYTGGQLISAASSYPIIQQIVEGMPGAWSRKLPDRESVHELGPDISVSAWVQAQKDVLTHLRNTVKFQGIVVPDGTGWATLLDVNAFQQVMAFDASLRGTANVIFSTHICIRILRDCRVNYGRRRSRCRWWWASWDKRIPARRHSIRST